MPLPRMGVAAFAVSVVLLVAVAQRVARPLGRTTAQRFWIAVGAGTLQVGAIATLLSLFRALTPIPFVACQAVLLAAVLFVTRGRPSGTRRRFRRRMTGGEKILLAAIVAIVLLTGFEQGFLSVSNIDDRNYRASRAAYWLGHQSIFGWDSHNDRQVAFPPGGSLPFFYAILFTRSETAGLAMTWSAFPLVAAGMYLLLRSLRQTRTVSLLGTTALCFTPIVLLHTRGVQPELWLTLNTLGCAFWAVQSLRRRQGVFASAAACAFACLAVNVRATALPLVAVTVLLPLLTRRNQVRRAGAALAGALVGLTLSGLMPVLIFNLQHFGHPLGSESFRRVHSAETSGEQVRVHAARALVTLLEIPFVPQPLIRSFQDTLDATTRTLRGDESLPREDQPWPGPFVPQVRRWAENYSLAGLLLLPVLAVASWSALRRRRILPLDVLTFLAVGFFLAVVFLVRWMGVMGRFWIAPYALTVVIGAVLLARVARRWRWVGGAGLILVMTMAIPAALHRALLLRGIAEPPPSVAFDEPYAEPLAYIAPGSTVLFAAGQATRDYPLFRPRDGLANDVVSWGKHPFDAGRMQKQFDEKGVTHVVVEDDRELLFEWDPPVRTASMVRWLTGHPDFRQVPLEYSPNMRLYVRRAAQLDPPEASR